MSPTAIATPYSWPTSSAIASACSGGSIASALPSSVSTRSSLRTGTSGSAVGDGAVVLRRAPGARTLGTLDRDLEVAAGGELVEVVAGDVGVQAELLGHLRRGDAVADLAGEQVDAAPGRIAERVGDRRHGGRERAVSHASPASGGTRHGGAASRPRRYSTYARSGNSRRRTRPTLEPLTAGAACRATNEIIDALRPVEDPELRRSIVDLGMVRNVDIDRRRHGRRARSPSPSPAARCATRSRTGSRPPSRRCPASPPCRSTSR